MADNEIGPRDRAGASKHDGERRERCVTEAAAPHGETAIRVRQLRYLPPGATRRALDGVSLDLSPGEFVAVLGHNGSGKSTLARHLAGLITPQSGRVTVDGMSTADPRAAPAIRRLVGL